MQDDGAPQQPSKTHIRYSVRHKRADAKNALKNLLFNGRASDHYSQDENNPQHSKNSERSKPQKASSGRGKQSKRRQRKKSFSDEEELGQPGMIFTANFGGQQSFTWSFNTWENCNYQNSTPGFEWKDESKSEKNRGRVWSESDIEEEANVVDQHSNRVALGLPASGPLCLADVKRAFRESALKWHPDKHHGLAQDMAAEKFKLCVDAYNNLCNAMKSS
ncbi:uncharacterized protein LOC110026890 isoform X2 [Phalaenopsis equestris]|uniref:uncharacterized protein LOC110026890 isoform X2 n=1 Tax=Phalaenopsis equestris TaxID=78828 RepID=UPI0009E3D7F2|nr:uncharacterized protein LOC110026890 isoform X2 [Phalaenopsis equestris]XP_020583752.1 uncharacterized protein LOC110026890 isoform X2 [Phalaenopsis equestris]